MINCCKYYLTICLATTVLFTSCVKDNVSSTDAAALTIVNSVNNSRPLVTNFTPLNSKGLIEGPLKYYNGATQISYMSWFEDAFSGNTTISLSQISDSSKNIWSGTLNLPIGSIHTLFLCGDTLTVDTVFTSDIIPYYSILDSVSGVRFINLVKGSLPMTINFQGNSSNQTEFSGLGYKQYSSFKKYPALAGSIAYTFEIRDQLSGKLLTTFNWNIPLFKNSTIVVNGSLDSRSLTPISAFMVNNY